MAVTLQSRPKRREPVLCQRSEDTVVLLSLGSGQYFALNQVGARIWELADGDLTVQDIALRLCEEYQVDRATIESDAIDVLSELRREQLIGVSD